MLRELHQIPEDYFRFTPFSLKKILSKNGFKDIKTKTSGGAFSAALYCLHQASEYLPKKEKKAFEKKYLKKEFNSLIKLEKKYKKNLIRKNTFFPVSFSLLAKT